VGATTLLLGFAPLTQLSPSTPQWVLMTSMTLTGIGMGLSVPIFLIAVQSAVPRQTLGTATSTVQFSRSMGGAIGASVMGVVLAIQLGAGFVAQGLDPTQISVDALLDPSSVAAGGISDALRMALSGAVQATFVVALLAAVCAWTAVVLAPRGKIGARAPLPAGQKVSAE
jgi:hypothetical protein